MMYKMLFKLVRKYGIVVVLRGLIEVAKTDKDDRMKVLVQDLNVALTKYNKSK